MKRPADGDREARTLEVAPKMVRKPYQKPAVRHEQVFETSALTCGKVNPTQGACHFARKTS